MHFTLITLPAVLLSTLVLVSAAPGIVNVNEGALANVVARDEGIVDTAISGPLPTHPPGLAMKVAAKPDYNGQPLTIHIQNTAGDSMHMNLKHDADRVGAICCPHNGPLPSSTQVTYPTGWAGRISIGPNPDEDVITRGSTIEADFTTGTLWFDVSYASGYTYPMHVLSIPPIFITLVNNAAAAAAADDQRYSVCSCGQGPITTGCNYPLLAHAAEDGGCPNPGPQICYNPNVGNNDIVQGAPAAPFFEPCQGSAFTYPHDFDAQDNSCGLNEIFCCVGILCPHNPKQHKGKRELEFAMYNGTLPADLA